MGISYTEVVSAGDILPNNRHVLRFPDIPDVAVGQDLTIRHSNVSLPPIQVGQIVVKLQGWSVAFAGIRTQQNTFTCEFYETINAPIVKTLVKWQDTCAGFRSQLAKMKADYAVKPQCTAYDTAGKSALIVDLINVWPMTITYGQFTEESAPAQVTVEFSVDAIDIVGIETTTGDFDMATLNSQSTPSPWYQSRSNNPVQNVLNIGAFRADEQITNQLGLNTNTISSILGGYFA